MKNVDYISFSGEIITPKNEKYNDARQEWNTSIEKFPLAILYCENKFDVRSAILWATKKDIPIRVRSGSHNYEGFSTGDRVVVIDISRMNNININKKANTVTVDGGTNMSTLYNSISNQGYPFPGGLCPTVGVSGFTLGGGWGYSSRYLGLGCDSLLELELINYKGYLIKANKNINSDLFWACCGAGGGNFGVIVSMTFNLPKKVDCISSFEINFPKVSKKLQKDFIMVWQKWITSVDNRINMNCGIYNSREDGFYIFCRGICYATPEETLDLLEPIINLSYCDVTVNYNTFLNIVNSIASTYPPSEKFISPGRFSDRLYTEYEIDNIVDIINKDLPLGSVSTAIRFYGLGGKTKLIGVKDTAFYYRDANYIFLIETIFDDNIFIKANSNWIKDNFRYIYSITNGSYVNFPYYPLPYYEFNYFGENISRLKEVKAKYDPHFIFTFPQGIK